MIRVIEIEHDVEDAMKESWQATWLSSVANFQTFVIMVGAKLYLGPRPLKLIVICKGPLVLAAQWEWEIQASHKD